MPPGIYSQIRGAYQQVSVSSYITNPEDIAEPTDGTSKEYYGFYEEKVESKKGMQGIHANAVDELGIQASLVNIHLNELIKIILQMLPKTEMHAISHMFIKENLLFP